MSSLPCEDFELWAREFDAGTGEPRGRRLPKRLWALEKVLLLLGAESSPCSPFLPPPQAIQHIEGTQEEEQRRAVIVTPVRASLDHSNSDTASDSDAEDSDAMDHSKAERP